MIVSNKMDVVNRCQDGLSVLKDALRNKMVFCQIFYGDQSEVYEEVKDLESLTTALDQEYSSKCKMIKNISESTVPFTLHLTPVLIDLVQMMLEQLFMDTMYI